MAITPLVLPSSSSAESPSLVTVHPAAIATILDQHLRRPRDQEGHEQDRVIGTLLGTRNEVSYLHIMYEAQLQARGRIAAMLAALEHGGWRLQKNLADLIFATSLLPVIHCNNKPCCSIPQCTVW